MSNEPQDLGLGLGLRLGLGLGLGLRSNQPLPNTAASIRI